jgi:NitT/TauT family transport system ATP-binding protein
MADEAAAGYTNVFECRGLTLELMHHGQRRCIVDRITLDVRRGEFLTVVGASGTGKTTLLRLLGGLTPQTGGTISFRGKPVEGPPDGVVVVFQDYSHALLQWRTVASNVALGLEGVVERAERDERVKKALQMVGLERCADDHPWQLSGGMQQRVQIARALALRPAVLLMDEPFGALDAMTKATLQDEVLGVHAQTGTSFVFITHDIEEAVYLGDRVVVLGGPPGRIHKLISVQLARPREQIETRQTPEFLHHRLEVHAAVIEAGRERHDAGA